MSVSMSVYVRICTYMDLATRSDAYGVVNGGF